MAHGCCQSYLSETWLFAFCSIKTWKVPCQTIVYQFFLNYNVNLDNLNFPLTSDVLLHSVSTAHLSGMLYGRPRLRIVSFFYNWSNYLRTMYLVNDVLIGHSLYRTFDLYVASPVVKFYWNMVS